MGKAAKTHTELLGAMSEAGDGNQGWWVRHAAAWQYPRGPEVGIVYMIRGLAAVADQHMRSYESRIGEDGVLGEAWVDSVRNVRTLLNGGCWRLDCGTLDSLLCAMLKLEGEES